MKYSILLVLIIGCFVLVLNAQTESNVATNLDSGPGHYELQNDIQLPIRIPFVMHNRKPVLDVEINGEKAKLMIDNGVLWEQVWFFGSPLVEKLQLKRMEEGELGGSGEGDPTAIYSSTPVEVKFDDVVFYDQPVLVSPPAAGFARMFPGTDGQLCNMFFKHFIVEFDFIENEVILHDPEGYKFVGEGSVLPMKQNENGTHSVPFEMTMLEGTKYKDEVMIDFGGVYPLKIALNSKHNIQLPDEVEETFSFGAQGRSSEYKGKIKNFVFGKYKFDNPTAVFGNRNTSRIHSSNLGVIGLPLFKKFDITFDYFNNNLYIKPNKEFNTEFVIRKLDK